ncbi:integrase core domain-containing protein [Jiella pelagia]|uniref:Integrase catalytic domain-containing protein n=1 Tax=Jiella pelagia TaxID=2986949 RepID=A0ABY7C8G5_9HYPH|nr:hypothetical protein [Jiella pelagia]WAP70070.1 hypothetical protein OH818_08000 [Jiella pelagia]
MAKWAGCRSDWAMFGRFECLATDGGPPFRDEFEDAVRHCRSGRSLPDQDPRMRGTIESFFRLFRRLCRYFTGQSFSNVVEKGDYEAEEMASLVFEGLVRAAIVFIVDSYHHRKHRGLGGRTPYAVWNEARG